MPWHVTPAVREHQGFCFTCQRAAGGGTAELADGKWGEFGYRLDAWGVAHWVIAFPLVLLAP